MTILTLDAGGTNFVFSALSDGKEIATPVCLPSEAADLDRCLSNLRNGFRSVVEQIGVRPAAISFAFPGPADYEHGIIGDLPNFPSFRGGIALGAYLEQEFGIPVFINNDGNLFAYGEAMAGMLPEVNRRLAESGSKRRYRNIIGITFGTGFGCGVVINGQLLTGDNGAGGDVWCLRNSKYPNLIAEESVSIRAVKRVYAELSGHIDESLTPYDIFLIAEGQKDGDAEAARRSFAEMGTLAGDSIATALTLIDGLVVIGGGLTGAAKYIMPSLMDALNAQLGTFGGDRFPRLQMKAYNLDDASQLSSFTEDTSQQICLPFSETTVDYNPVKCTGVAVSQLGASRAIALGAYHFAVNNLNK